MSQGRFEMTARRLGTRWIYCTGDTGPGQRSGEDRRAKKKEGGGGRRDVYVCVCVSEAVSVLSLKIGQLITARDTESLRLSCDLYITWEANNFHVYHDVAMDKQTN